MNTLLNLEPVIPYKDESNFWLAGGIIILFILTAYWIIKNPRNKK